MTLCVAFSAASPVSLSTEGWLALPRGTEVLAEVWLAVELATWGAVWLATVWLVWAALALPETVALT